MQKNNSTYLRVLFALLLLLLTSLPLRATGFYAPNIFTTRIQISLPTGAQTIATGDLNNDGKTDLIAGRSPDTPGIGNISVLLGKGNGTFQRERKFIVGFDSNGGASSPYINDIAIADFNNDNKLDVVVAHNPSLSISNFNRLFTTVLLGDGNGGFSSARFYYFGLDSFDSIYATSLAVGDYDLDGDVDVYLCGGLPPDIGLIYPMMNLGNGMFQVTAPRLIGAFISDIAVADFNQDSKQDVVTATDRGAIILYGQGNLYFSSGEQRDGTRVEEKVTVGDFNLDGKPDFIIVDPYRSEIRTFLNSVSGIAQLPINNRIKLDISTGIINADFNQDNIPDLAVSLYRLGKVRVLLGNGHGSFGNAGELQSGQFPQGLAAANLNSDGKMDLVVTNSDSAPSEKIDVFLNSPNP